MVIALWVLAVVLVAAGLVGLVLPLIPGVPLVYLGIVAAAWAEGFTKIGGLTLALCGALAAVAFAVDYVAGVLGAKRMGATPWGLFGAVVGTVVGLFFGFPGLIFGRAAPLIRPPPARGMRPRHRVRPRAHLRVVGGPRRADGSADIPVRAIRRDGGGRTKMSALRRQLGDAPVGGLSDENRSRAEPS